MTETNEIRPLTDDELLAVSGGWATYGDYAAAVGRAIVEGVVQTFKSVAGALPH